MAEQDEIKVGSVITIAGLGAYEVVSVTVTATKAGSRVVVNGENLMPHRRGAIDG